MPITVELRQSSREMQNTAAYSSYGIHDIQVDLFHKQDAHHTVKDAVLKPPSTTTAHEASAMKPMQTARQNMSCMYSLEHDNCNQAW